MGYSIANGLIKIGGTRVPLEFLDVEGYKVKAEQRMAVAAERTAEGGLIYETYNHKPAGVILRFLEMNQSQLNVVMQILHEAYREDKGGELGPRKVSAEYFRPEFNNYAVEDFYIPDFETPINYIDGDVIWYKPITIELKGY